MVQTDAIGGQCPQGAKVENPVWKMVYRVARDVELFQGDARADGIRKMLQANKMLND